MSVSGRSLCRCRTQCRVRRRRIGWWKARRRAACVRKPGVCTLVVLHKSPEVSTPGYGRSVRLRRSLGVRGDGRCVGEGGRVGVPGFPPRATVGWSACGGARVLGEGSRRVDPGLAPSLYYTSHPDAGGLNRRAVQSQSPGSVRRRSRSACGGPPWVLRCIPNQPQSGCTQSSELNRSAVQTSDDPTTCVVQRGWKPRDPITPPPSPPHLPSPLTPELRRRRTDRPTVARGGNPGTLV